MYSQNNEEEIILNHFGDFTGIVLDIGANDGKTFSNSYELVKNRGWKGVLVEPSLAAFLQLMKNYEDAESDVIKFKIAISNKNQDQVEFLESGSFERKGEDVALLSTLLPEETKRWGDTVDFTKTTVTCWTFQRFWDYLTTPTTAVKFLDPVRFDFISIDAEGMDWEILQQIDMNAVDCSCFCIEHNGVPAMIENFAGYAAKYGFNQIGFNAENVIYARPIQPVNKS